MKRLLFILIIGLGFLFALPILGSDDSEISDSLCECDPDYPNHTYLHGERIPHNHCERIVCNRDGEERIFTYAPKIAPGCPEFLVDFETGEWECK